MKAHVVAIAFTLASITPGLAQTNKPKNVQHPKQYVTHPIAAVRINTFVRARTVPVDSPCTPYSGLSWLEGYPGTGRC